MKKSEYQLQIIFKIKQEREARGLGQKNIANILGISEGHVGNIESPKFPQKYTLKQLDTLCKYFKMPTEQLFITDDIYVQEDINITTLLVEKIVEYEN
ncbi:MAG: helix-turn-helix transcriptional regulator [Alistipes sp.]|nr:helix-turn-helix transcriptional regulator [Alistipes sp.]